jgi:hypothetical protein
LVKNGRWVEASEVYREVARLEATEGKVEAQQQAQREAESELAALARRIPSIVISVAGVAADQVAVQIDAVQVPTALLGEARPLNPGKHRIVGKFRDQMVEQAIEVKEAERRDVRLAFKPAPAAAVTPVPMQKGAEGEPSEPSEPSNSAQQVGGWVALGVGAAGLVAGGVTGLMVLGKKKKLEDNEYCQGRSCEEGAYDDVDSYNRLRTISSACFIVGAVGAAAGATLLLTLGDDAADNGTDVSAFVGLGQAGIVGSF